MSKIVAVKLFNAALDEAEDSPAGIVLRGALDVESLHHIMTDDYQREAQPLSSQWRILDALENGTRLPDLDLGMRGQSYTSREGVFYLKDSVYVIDGLQRISTIIHYISKNPDATVRIGAIVHFDTNRTWERDRFHRLNNWRNKLSPNITLRNMREENPAVLMLYGLSCNDKGFVLQGRVSWSQNMSKGEMISALTFAKTVGVLLSHKTSSSRTNVEEVAAALKRGVETIGIQTMRENIRTFFELIDECWGIKSVKYKEGAIYMRGSFLHVLAKLLSDHYDFWQKPDEKRLFINVDLRRKIAQFPIHDPEVVRLAGAGGKARDMLYMLLRDHINSGKRTKRLKSRHGDAVILNESSDNGDEEQDVA